MGCGHSRFSTPTLASGTKNCSDNKRPSDRCQRDQQQQLQQEHQPWPRLIVFDFDQTLCEIHVRDPLVDRGPLGTPRRIQMLSDMLTTLTSPPNPALVSICTYNRKSVVEQVLRDGGIWDHFDPKLVVADQGPKSTAIKEELLDPLGISPECVLFLDDSKAHLDEVVGCLFRHRQLHDDIARWLFYWTGMDCCVSL
jgi:FMN phosphatase YigB (HAD superfamily)